MIELEERGHYIRGDLVVVLFVEVAIGVIGVWWVKTSQFKFARRLGIARDGVNKRPASFLSLYLGGYSLWYLAEEQKTTKQIQIVPKHTTRRSFVVLKEQKIVGIGQKVKTEGTRRRASPRWSDTALARDVGATRGARVAKWGRWKVIRRIFCADTGRI